ncbi:transporter [uncultured Muriicola sp.]|uniref:transporter n=1 Tax=uncultured Muriicola sp. TaxID=1583102 RepID=UPI002637762F|nr:transporter [uncultured Muriicola sp.]
MNACLKTYPVPFYLIFLCSALPFLGTSQYTDVINSNRPGLSVSAYAVGKGVIQAEMGFLYEQREHVDLSQESTLMGADLALRYGFFREMLEITYEGTYVQQDITYTAFDLNEKRTDFSRNRLGIKYLLYDPYKNPDRTKPNLYSWRANNKFQLKDLVPAISVYAGATFNLGDNPFYPEDPIVAPRAMIATQSSVTSRLVLITNLIYDRIGTDFPEMEYLISLSHAFKNPKWSVFIENQGIKSDRYADILFRTGIAHLFNKSFQADINVGGSIKSTPSRIFGALGLSYRVDFHQDEIKSIDDQRSGENGDFIKKNAFKKDTDNSLPGISKKKMRKLERKAKRKKN